MQRKPLRLSLALLCASSALTLGCYGNSHESDANPNKPDRYQPTQAQSNSETRDTTAKEHVVESTPIDPALSEQLKEADNTFRTGKYAEALELYKALANEAEVAGQVSIQMEALAQCARMVSLTSRDFEACAEYLSQVESAGNDTYPSGWSRYLGVRGIYERELGQQEKCIATFAEMRDYCKAHDLPGRAVDAIHHMALAAPLTEQPKYALEAIDIAEHGTDETRRWLGPLWNNLGNTYHDLGVYEEALKAFEKAKYYHGLGEREMPKMMADWAVARALRMVGSVGKAEAMLKETQAWAERLREGEGGKQAYEFIGMCKQELGGIEADRGNKNEALKLLQEARAIYVEVGYPQNWPEGMEIIDAQIASLR